MIAARHAAMGHRRCPPVARGLVTPEGEILLETTANSPFLTAEVDLTAVDRARQTYPRNLVIPSSPS